MRICILYDCLFPWTIGGAERWYRNMAERLADSGHEVTFLTLQQWDDDSPPAIPGVNVIAVGPRLALYTGDGRRRIAPPLRFGWGVFLHLARHGGRYDYVHTASFPFFSLIAAALCRPFWRYRLAVDWHEVWSRDYWRGYLGPALGMVGWWVQALCARLPHKAYSFSNLHAKRLRELAPNRTVTVLPGEYAQSAEETEPRDAAKPTTILYAGRMIAEKRVPLLVDALALVLRDRPEVRAVLLGNGPERASIETQVHELGLADRITMPGFVDDPTFETLITTAAVLVQPSMREGYGMVVVESAARGVPVVVVEAPDNAATELVTPGINGAIAQRADPDCLAASIKACLDTGPEMRMSTRAWFLANADRLSLGNSLSIIANDLSN